LNLEEGISDLINDNIDKLENIHSNNKKRKKDEDVIKTRNTNIKKRKLLNLSFSNPTVPIYESGSKEKTCTCKNKCGTRRCPCRGNNECDKEVRLYCSEFCACDKNECKNVE